MAQSRTSRSRHTTSAPNGPSNAGASSKIKSKPKTTTRPKANSRATTHSSTKPHVTPKSGTVPVLSSNTNHVSVSKNGLTVTAYRGNGSVLLGFDVNEHQTD